MSSVNETCDSEFRAVPKETRDALRVEVGPTSMGNVIMSITHEDGDCIPVRMSPDAARRLADLLISEAHFAAAQRLLNSTKEES